MSERMTSICLPGSRGYGLSDWGRKSAPEMITMLRAKAARELVEAQAMLAASDGDFLIETYLGPHVQRNREVLQGGKKKAPAN